MAPIPSRALSGFSCHLRHVNAAGHSIPAATIPILVWRFATSYFDGLPNNVAGSVLIGAEGCAGTAGETWLREGTEDERAAFEAYCRRLVHNRHGKKAATEFSLSDFTVDGNNRPYWLKAVLNVPEAPEIALEKARRYTRCLRIHCSW
jgi:hypothetical protein